jgi:CubicO group peptidase (beta-lactamase class C family)
MKNLLLIIVFTLGYSSIAAQNIIDTLSLKFDKIAQEATMPGFAVALVHHDKVLYQKGFGYADKDTKRPFTDTTIQNIGSITKTLIAVSLMQLVEQGKIQLEDDINQYLPFKISNPYFPNEKITIRQLATHTSSLTDGKDDMVIEYSYVFKGDINFKDEELPENYPAYFNIYQTNRPMIMGRFLYNAYCLGGDWYAKTNFLNQKPGTTYQYTNIGATLLAYIIEEVAGQKFEDYTKEYIFKPLSMKNSGWSLENIVQEQLATHYLSNGLVIPNYELITKPDGGLLTNVNDFSLYLMDMIRGLNGNGKLMKQESYRQMMSNQLIDEYFPNGNFERPKGMMWSVNQEGDNVTMNGSDPGILTYTLFTTQGNLGMVIFTNTNIDDNDAIEADFNKIRGTLFQYAGKLLKYHQSKS